MVKWEPRIEVEPALPVGKATRGPTSWNWTPRNQHQPGVHESGVFMCQHRVLAYEQLLVPFQALHLAARSEVSDVKTCDAAMCACEAGSHRGVQMWLGGSDTLRWNQPL